MYKEDLALNILQGLIWHKTKPNRYLSLPPPRQDLTQGQKPEGQLK